MGKKKMIGSRPGGFRRDLALTRRQKKRFPRSGQQSSVTTFHSTFQESVDSSLAAEGNTLPAAAAVKVPTGDRRYPTLARMAAIARQPESSGAFSKLSPIEAGQSEDLAGAPVPGEAGVADPEPLVKARERFSHSATRLAHDALAETDPLLREYSLPRPQPLPKVDLVFPVAVVQAGIAAVSALVTAVLLLYGSTTALWLVGLTMIAGLGSWLAYVMAYGSTLDRKGAGAVLLCSQLGMLAWSMALLGPHVSLLMLAPVLLLLSLRMTSRLIAVTGILVVLATYLLFEILWLHQVFRPVLQLNDAWLTALNSLLAIVGTLLLLGAALDLHTSYGRAEHLARARLQELRQVRTRAAQLRQWTEDEAARLQELLMAALYGHRDLSSMLEGPLSPLNATIELCGERLAILQRGREEQLRLEAALRSLTRAMERAWLGLPWTWPAPSGTLLDQLVALLRTPTPRDVHPEAVPETSPLVPIPSLDPSLTPPPWEAPRQHPRVREHLSDSAWSVAQDASGSPTGHASPLPWLEWDEWRNWEDRLDDRIS
ncbi:MAG: hypothetical protein ACLQUY_16430 [Ktedonobacterales bacterium]